MSPKFSVIIPLYNKVAYVRKTLDSVMAQTFTDFELIVVDDGSTDNSLEIVHERLKELESERIYVISQTNSGVGAARNNGVKASKGEFVCFLDADDWWEPTFLEEINKLIAAYPDAGLYATNYIYYKPGKTHVALNLPSGYMNYSEAYYRSAMMPITSITTCMPRRVFDEMGGFPVGIKLGEDFLLWAKTTMHYPVAFCDKPLAYYKNDVPALLRATCNLHAPESHMLFHLDSLEEEINHSLVTSWHQLFDKLRVKGLLPYWISKEYHDAAAVELAKVDWNKQPKSVIRVYKTPIWMLNVWMSVKRVGSACKQKTTKVCKL